MKVPLVARLGVSFESPADQIKPQLFLDVFLGLTLTGPKKASKSTILYNRLNKEKNSWSKLPMWLLAAMMITMYYWKFGNPAQMLC